MTDPSDLSMMIALGGHYIHELGEGRGTKANEPFRAPAAGSQSQREQAILTLAKSLPDSFCSCDAGADPTIARFPFSPTVMTYVVSCPQCGGERDFFEESASQGH